MASRPTTGCGSSWPGSVRQTNGHTDDQPCSRQGDSRRRHLDARVSSGDDTAGWRTSAWLTSALAVAQSPAFKDPSGTSAASELRSGGRRGERGIVHQDLRHASHPEVVGRDRSTRPRRRARPGAKPRAAVQRAVDAFAPQRAALAVAAVGLSRPQDVFSAQFGRIASAQGPIARLVAGTDLVRSWPRRRRWRCGLTARRTRRRSTPSWPLRPSRRWRRARPQMASTTSSPASYPARWIAAVRYSGRPRLQGGFPARHQVTHPALVRRCSAVPGPSWNDSCR